METTTKQQKPTPPNHPPSAPSGGYGKGLLVLLLVSLIGLAACGGGSSTTGQSAQLSGNWQFSMTNPDPNYPNSTLYGLQGGFLLQNNGQVMGQAVYSISGPISGESSYAVCDSGSAPITGTISGQNAVALTANAGSQTFTLQATLGSNGLLMNPTFTTPGGSANGFSSCGMPTPPGGLQWSAFSVPPLTGGFQGNFHSTSGANGFQNQDFPVSGFLTQGENIGASSATVTGTLIFKDPVTLLNDYPCLTTAYVNGQISGNSVILQIFNTNGSDVGQIGGITTSSPVTFDSTQNGYVLHNAVSTGTGYAVVNTKGCPGVSIQDPGDYGNICLAFGNANACTQPITLSPISLTFPAQVLGSAPTTQTITLANTDSSGSTLTGLSLKFLETDSGLFYSTGGDFNGLPNFTEQDNCGTPPFSLAPPGSPGSSCTITITFSPQESCPWLPFQISGNPPIDGLPPAECPNLLGAGLTVNSPQSADQDTSFLVPVSGTGLSAVVPATPQLDFGAEALGETSQAQTLTFTNQSANPVQILPAANAPCGNSPPVEVPRPITNDGALAGLQVARTDSSSTIEAIPPTVQYSCDVDAVSGQPNFQISSDTCLGAVLNPQQSCSLQIVFVPQKGTNQNGVIGNGLDYFLELNTLQCSSAVSSDCEIDSGRFPVELKTNPPSPLRMSPGAGLNFGLQTKGTASAPLTVTLFNDPNDPNSATVNFAGKILKGSDYSESDTCPFSLTPGSSCALTFIFTPTIVGFDPGTLTLSYNNGLFQTIYLWGTGQ